jgi:uncharacterized protein YcbX
VVFPLLQSVIDRLCCSEKVGLLICSADLTVYINRENMPLDADAFGSRPAPFLGGLVSIEQLFLILYPTFLIPAVWLWTREKKRKRHCAENPRGCKRVGIHDQALSSLRDEYDDDNARHNTATSHWKVKGLFIYPIKSCAPVEVDKAHIEGPGMRYDRNFAFAEFVKPQKPLSASEEEKRPRWMIRTQRDQKYQKLALVRSEVWIPDNPSVPHGWLVVRYPNEARGALAWLDRLFLHLGLVGKDMVFQVPLSPPKAHTYPKENVVIWKNEMRWVNYGSHLPHDFKVFIGTDKPLTIFGIDPEEPRKVYGDAPREDELGYQSTTGFADGYPLHLLNLASVRDVAVKVREDIPKFSARRYRGNILVTGPKAYDEDDWKKIRIGKHELFCSCHTVRCRLPNVDPDTGIKHDVEPDKTLKSFRCIDANDPGPCLGLQLVPSKETGTVLTVGDAVEVLKRSE